MQLWWRKPAPAPAAPTPAAPAPVATQPPAWTQLPALQRVVTPTPAIAPLDAFVGSLSTRQDPSFLAPLAHAVDASAPSGSVGGLVQPGLPQQVHGGLDLPLRSPSAAGPATQRSVQRTASSPPELPAYAVPVSTPAPTVGLTTAPPASIDRELPTVDSAEPVGPVTSSAHDAGQTAPPAQDAPLTGAYDVESPAPPSSGESPADAGEAAAPLPTLPLAMTNTAATATGPVVSRSIDTSTPAERTPGGGHPRFDVQPPIDLTRADHPLVGEPATGFPPNPAASVTQTAPPPDSIPPDSTPSDSITPLPLPLRTPAAPTVSRLIGDPAAAAPASTPTTWTASSQAQLDDSPSQSSSDLSMTVDTSHPAPSTATAGPAPSGGPASTAPTVGLAAPLPVQTHPDTAGAQAPAPVSRIPSPPLSPPARRGLGAPLPPEGASIQRQAQTGAPPSSAGGVSGAAGAGPAALVGLAHILDQSSGEGPAPTLPQQIIQRSAGFGYDTAYETISDAAPDQTEPTFAAATDAPLVGDNPAFTASSSVDVRPAGPAGHRSSASGSAPELILATSNASSVQGPPQATSGASASVQRSAVPLQRYAGIDSVPTTPPSTGPTTPLIGDLPPIAVLTGATAGPTEEQVQRAVEVAVPVRYDPPPMPESPGAGNGSAAAQSSRSVPTRTPTTPGASEFAPAAGSGLSGSSGVPLQRTGASGWPALPAATSGSPHPTGQAESRAVQRFGQSAEPALVVARSLDPGQAAISAGVAQPDGANSVVFDRPFEPPDPTIGASEVQRAPEATTTMSVAAPAAAAAPATPDINELAQRLFDPLSARLKTELWLDRERAGFVTDLRR